MSFDDDVWVVIPSASAERAKAADEVWACKGYRRFFLLPEDSSFQMLDGAVLFIENSGWRGYPTEVNEMLRQVPGPVAVAGADDLLPDGRFTAAEIAAEFVRHFPALDGVMQPTGDPWESSAGRRCELICGSPWIGRAWIDGANDGAGAFWPAYKHWFADEEMAVVAESQGRLWREPFLRQDHMHWHRNASARPRHMAPERVDGWWRHDRELFDQRKSAGFPGAGMST